jgi:hypothetical protein
MSWRRPEIAAAGRIDLLPLEGGRAGAILGLLYDDKALTPKVERIEIKDDRLRGSWGGRIYRILLSGKAAEKTGTVKVRIE